jgi:hypothetical protein
VSKISKARSDADVLKRQGFRRASEEAAQSIVGLQQNIFALQERQFRESLSVVVNSQKQRLEDRAKVAQVAIDKLQDETKGQSLLNKEIERYKRNVIDLAAVGRAPSKAQQDTDIAALRKKFNPGGVAQAAAEQNAVQVRLQGLGDERAALGQQIAQFDKYGRAVENTARTVLD